MLYLKIMARTKINPQILRKVSQLTNEAAPQVKRETKPLSEGLSEKIFESEMRENRKKQELIEQLKVQKEAWAKKRIQKIEEEMRILVQKRREETRARYQQKASEEQQKQDVEKTKFPLPEAASKPKRGLPFWGRRIKSAQQQAQPETAGRRVGG